MLHHVVSWMRREAEEGPGKGRLARWIGRNWARLNYAVRVEPTWLELNKHEVPISDLTAPFHGLRIVQLSDIHCGQRLTSSYLNEAVDLAQAQGGDITVLTGDFIHKGHKHISRMAEAVGRLSAPHGVYAVLGNHDYSVRNSLGIRRHQHLHRDVADALTAQGIRVLHNETVPVIREGQKIHLAGVADLWSRVCDLDQAFAGTCPSIPRIVLAHNPRTVERLGSHRCDLMLSGHTHGGQVNLPGLGRVTLGKKVKRFAAGMYQYRSSYIYVHKGVGFGFPLRYGVRPEVAVFTLRPAQSV